MWLFAVHSRSILIVSLESCFDSLRHSSCHPRACAIGYSAARMEAEIRDHCRGYCCPSSSVFFRVNYSALPRSGLPGPCLLRTERPVSVSERAGTDPTASTRRGASRAARQNANGVLRTVPDSAGGFPLRAVRSVPLLPNRHSATTDDACLLSRLNTAGNVVSILFSPSTEEIIRVPIHTKPRRAGAVSPLCSLRSLRIARDRRSR